MERKRHPQIVAPYRAAACLVVFKLGPQSVLQSLSKSGLPCESSFRDLGTPPHERKVLTKRNCRAAQLALVVCTIYFYSNPTSKFPEMMRG
jgi:hypothetical protein